MDDIHNLIGLTVCHVDMHVTCLVHVPSPTAACNCNALAASVTRGHSRAQRPPNRL